MSIVNAVWLVGAPLFDADEYGRMTLRDFTLRTMGLRAFSCEGAAATHATEMERAELRSLLTEDILGDYVSDVFVEHLSDGFRHRLNQLLHGEAVEGDFLLGPFHELSDEACDEVLEILYHLKWVVQYLDVEG